MHTFRGIFKRPYKNNKGEINGKEDNEFFKGTKRHSEVNPLIQAVGIGIVSVVTFFACETIRENPLVPIDPREPEILITYAPGVFCGSSCMFTELKVGTVDSCTFVIRPNDSQVYSVEFTVREREPNFYQCVCEQDEEVIGIARWNVQPADTGLTVLKITSETSMGTIEKEHIVQAIWELETVQSGITSELDTVQVQINETENFYINVKPDTTGKAEVSILDPTTTEVSSIKIQEGESRIIYTIVLEGETKRFALKINEIGLDYVEWSLDIIKE